MAHSRIWEHENSQCYYERAQLDRMILSWEPDIFEQKIQDFDNVLGIYTQKYFEMSRYGRVPFLKTPNETSISLMKLRPNMNGDKFAIQDDGKVTILFSFIKKLWNGNDDYSKMMIIDNALINSKLASFKKVPLTTYRWPLAFTLSTKKVKIILNNHRVSRDD